MELTLRPYVTAGIVVACAGLIAAAPVGPAPLAVQSRAVQLVDVVGDLTGGQTYPIVSWTDAYNDTVTSLQDLDKLIGTDPTPILSQIDANLMGYANDIATGFQNSSTNLTTALQDFGPLLTTALSELQSGDLYDAQTSIEQFLLITPLDVTRPLFSAFFEVSQSMANNLDNVLTANGAIAAAATPDIMSIGAVPVWFSDLREAALFGPNAAEYALAGVSQDISDALAQGDTSLALSDLLNAPSTIFDAYLNGYDVDGSVLNGLAADIAVPRGGLDPSEGALNGGREAIFRAEEIIKADLGGGNKLFDSLLPADPAATADWSTFVGDIGNLLNPDTALGEIAAAFDPNAVADITSLLSGDLAPNASGWVVDLFSLF